MRRSRLQCLACAFGAAALLAAAPAPARTLPVSITFESLPAFDEPHTPAQYDRVGLLKTVAENKTPDAVLIILPGFTAGAGLVRSLAAAIVERADGRVAVWAVDRRTFALEDHRGMRLGGGDPSRAFAYYFSSGSGFTERKEADFAFMRYWGVATTVQDVRAVVHAARARYPHARILLGGHSMGATIAQAFAAWDFEGTPGFREIDGLVLIDGGGHDDDWVRDTGLKQYHEGIAAIEKGEYYWNDPARGASPEFLRLGEIGAFAALGSTSRDAPSFLAPLLPQMFTLPPGVVITNAAAFGLATDHETTKISYFAANCGTLDHTPRAVIRASGVALLGWKDAGAVGEPTSLFTFAAALTELRETNGLEWYGARALNAEIDLLANLDSRSPLTAALCAQHGLTATHTAEVNLPVFGFACGQSEDTTDRLEWYRGRIASSDVTLLTAADYAHLDPLFAGDRAGGNRLLAALVPWLKKRVN